MKRYRGRPCRPTGGTVRLEYEGPFDFGLSDQQGGVHPRLPRDRWASSRPRGSTSPATASGTPTSARTWSSSTSRCALPDGWHVISQGNGTSRDERGHWPAGTPTGPWTRSTWSAARSRSTARRRARSRPSSTCASPTTRWPRKYLDATAQYIEMYRELIGPYPYGKFALVENFWETGYGMPSFTLLGPRVIRFPFILASSYPHEILHNWWGNSVFVDYETGQLVRGADRLHGRPPHPGAAGPGRASTGATRSRSTATTCRTAATSRSPSSAPATAPPPRPSATARR